MDGIVETRLRELGIELPDPSVPAANFIPTKRVGSLLFISGQIPQWNGERRYVGKLGAEYGVAEGQAAARLCALNLLAHLKKALDGDLDRVVGCVRLGGFVNSVPEFTNPPQVVNGASDLVVEIFGERGKHVRTAIGTNVLPGNVAVEVDGIFEVR